VLPVHIIDDDHSLRTSLKRILTLSGYSVHTHAAAKDFLESVADQEAVALIDLHMPDMSGLELLQELRQRRSPVRVALITAYPRAVDVQKAMDAGAVGVLTKPLEESTLLDLLGRVQTSD
jgi:two-component system response regulator FixJ